MESSILSSKASDFDIFKKYARFHEWCIDNGIIAPKIHYPGRFENGLLGIQCVEPIEYHEAYLYVPYKLTLTTNMVDTHPVLGEIAAKYTIF